MNGEVDRLLKKILSGANIVIYIIDTSKRVTKSMLGKILSYIEEFKFTLRIIKNKIDLKTDLSSANTFDLENAILGKGLSRNEVELYNVSLKTREGLDNLWESIC